MRKLTVLMLALLLCAAVFGGSGLATSQDIIFTCDGEIYTAKYIDQNTYEVEFVYNDETYGEIYTRVWYQYQWNQYRDEWSWVAIPQESWEDTLNETYETFFGFPTEYDYYVNFYVSDLKNAFLAEYEALGLSPVEINMDLGDSSAPAWALGLGAAALLGVTALAHGRRRQTA